LRRTGLEREGLSSRDTVLALRSMEVSTVWREGGRWKWYEVLVVTLDVVTLSQAVGVPEEADQPRRVRVNIGGAYS
jgi:hypothetical protein